MASTQTMPSTLAMNAAFASDGKNVEASVKKGSGSFSIAWLLVAACSVSLVLSVLDKYLFSDGDDGGISELLLVGALIAGAVIFAQRRNDKWSGRMPCKMTAPVPSRQHADDMMTLPSRADFALISDIIDAGHKGSFDMAEKRFGQLVQRLGEVHEFAPSCDAPEMAPEVAVDTLIEVCIQAGDAKRASVWLEALHGCGMSYEPKTIHSVLDELSNGASRTEAEQLLSRMLAAGARMDMACYQLLFDRLVDDDESVERYLQRLALRGASELQTGYVALVRSRAAVGDCEAAARWTRHGAAALAALGRNQAPAAARSSDLSRGTPEQRLIHLLKDGAEPDEDSLRAVVDAFARRSPSRGTERLMELMGDSDIEAEIVTLAN